MEIIRGLEEKFHNLDARLNSNSKQELANVICTRDLESIEHLFNAKKQRYKNGLDECRQEMLDQLIHKRKEQLNEVNEFMQSSQQINLSELESLHKSIKQNYAAFAKGLATVYESILFRTKLANPLKLAQLVKYSKIMSIEEKVNLADVEHLLDLSNLPYYCVHVLPSNRILLYCSKKGNILVLNKSGDLIHLKKTEKDCYYDVKVNSTNILAKSRHNQCVEIYDFKLELVHTIRLERFYFDSFKLNNYEIALSEKKNAFQLIIDCFNYKTVETKKKEICINIDQFKRILGFDTNDKGKFCFQLVDLNDRFIFIAFFDRRQKPYNRIILLNRHDNNNVFKHFRSERSPARWVIYNNQIASISEEFLEIYEMDGSEKERIERVIRIGRMYSTSKYKYIFSSKYNANDSSLELDLY